MKRTMVLVMIVVLAGAIAGCDLLSGFLDPPATPSEQASGFVAAANADPQVPEAMKAYFDPDAADYPSMQNDDYWVDRFFNPSDGPYTLLGAVEESTGSTAATVTGFVTNAYSPPEGYPVVFEITGVSEESVGVDPLIRRITVTVGATPLIIEKVAP